MPDAGSEPPLRLSWSRIRQHQECAAMGKLLRDHKSPVTDVRNFFHGNVVDQCQRRWLSQPVPEPGWMLAHVDEIMAETEVHARESGDGVVRWRTATDKTEVRDFCRELVTRLEPILTEYCLPFSWDPAVRFEVPIQVTYLDGSLREIHLVGEIDLMVQDSSGRLAVWDLKGTRDDQYWRKTVGQLVFYAIAVKALMGRWPVMTGLMQPMCTQRVLPVSITPQAVRETWGAIERTAQDIWAGRLSPKADNDGCSYCPVHNACPKFRVSGTGRVALAG
jgi:hypothetical protein